MFAENLKSMNLFTSVEMPAKLPQWSHRDGLMLLGSCFTTHIGKRLEACKFRCDTNPYGVLYNPLSIATALKEIAGEKSYEKKDLYFAGGLWHSAMHHGDFSSSSADETSLRINSRLQRASAEMHELTGLLLTWGTAWVYEEKDTGRVVGNCHKLPERTFVRRMLSVDEIVCEYDALLNRLWEQSPSLNILFTVSPIRHIRDGLHANQLSRATLLLAVDTLQQRYPQRIAYFPAYELLIDELRDYRFYAEDMVHPSPLAVRYLWQRFSDACFSPETLRILEAVDDIRRDLEHRPFHPHSEAYHRFLGQIVLKIERLIGKYPYLDLQKELELCHIRLNP